MDRDSGTNKSVLLASSRAVPINQVSEQRENRRVKDGVDTNGDPQKPAECPREGFVRGGHNEFGDLKTW